MSERVEGSVGQALREAREAQNLTLDDVTMRLRLMHRQILAMETDDFGSLGQPVFARGFVRNYARLLGLPTDALLARMEGAPAEPVPVVHSEPPVANSWLTSPWLILLMLGVLVVVAVPVSLYLWLNSDAGETHQAAPAAVTSPPAPAPAPVQVKPIPIEAAAEVPAVPAEIPAAPEAGAAVVGEAGAVVEPATTVPGAAPNGVVHLEFGGDAWVEVKDATGHMLHRQLNPAGSSVEIRGQPPFDMVVGNAAKARMTYNGRPVDLSPFIGVTVARFTLEQ